MSESRLKAVARIAPRTAYKPGQSGNPGGRRKLTSEQKAELTHFIEACRLRSREALQVIVQLMKHADRETVRLAAAQFIIERAYGKPVTPIEHS